MASKVGINNSGEIVSDIDYSLVDGRIRQVEIKGIMIYDEDKGIAEYNWEAEVWLIVKRNGFDIDREHGLSAFIYPLMKKFEPERYKALYL